LWLQLRTLASEEKQKKAVAEMDGIEIEGRKIAVNLAVDKPDEDRPIQWKCYSCGKMGHIAISCKGDRNYRGRIQNRTSMILSMAYCITGCVIWTTALTTTMKSWKRAIFQAGE